MFSPNCMQILIILYKGYVWFKVRNSISTRQRQYHQPDFEAEHTDNEFERKNQTC